MNKLITLLTVSFFLLGNHSFIQTEKGTKIQIQKNGSKGELLIFIHGGPGMPGYMDTLANQFLTTNTTVTYYQRDKTNSPSVGPFTVQKHVDDLLYIIEYYSKSYKSISIIAHSWGTNLVLSSLARRKLRNIKQIVLLSPAPVKFNFFKDFYASIYKKASKNRKSTIRKYIETWKNPDFKSTRIEYQYHQQWFKEILPYYFYSKSQENKRKILSEIQSDYKNWEGSKEAVKSFYSNSTLREQIYKKNKTLKNLYLLYGTEDPFYSRDNMNWFKETFKSINIFSFTDTGHCPWLEDSNSNFLKKLKKLVKGKLND